MSKKHGTEKYQMGDEQHLKAMSKMMELMKSPDTLNDWFERDRKEFDSLPED